MSKDRETRQLGHGRWPLRKRQSSGLCHSYIRTTSKHGTRYAGGAWPVRKSLLRSSGQAGRLEVGANKATGAKQSTGGDRSQKY